LEIDAEIEQYLKDDPSSIFDIIPEVLPEEKWHDGWDGAAGAEVRDHDYEAYPHQWDRTLAWCRITFAMHYNVAEEISKAFTEEARSIDKIPNWIYRRLNVYTIFHRERYEKRLHR
jgi:hypothetical protein